MKMTLTSQGCPSAQAIPEQVRQRIAAIEEVRDVKVEIVWEPAWNPAMISEAGRKAARHRTGSVMHAPQK